MIKRGILLVVGWWLFTASLEAAPALRGLFKVKQADGTMLSVEQFGDEWHHWTATADGVIVLSTDKGYCVAQIDEQGQLSATDVLAHEPALRNSTEQAAISHQAARRSLFHEQGWQTAASHRAATIGDDGYLPHSGSPRVLTILAAFQDIGFTVNDPVEAFNQYLNGDVQEDLGNYNQLNVASVRQYFETSSNHQFAPQFDIVGPVTLPHNVRYYGGSTKNGSDEKFGDFCRDAISQARELVDDWSVYDNDSDGRVELVCVIYAGLGQNQGGADSTIWAKASRQNIEVDSTLRITRLNCCSELFHPQRPDYINGTGVFIHEFSHCMGLPDLYATNKEAYVDNQGMETWSIMDYGLYNNYGFAPSAYTAWEQEVMGWTEIEDISSMLSDGGCQLDEILPLIEDGKAYKLVNSDDKDDYIVMENIQKRGLNKYALGHGLLVYHVAYPYADVRMDDAPNNTPGRPAVAVVPASGRLVNSIVGIASKERTENMATAIFPGSQEVTSLNDQMQLPNYRFYDGDSQKPVGVMLSAITENAETGGISLTLTLDDTSGMNLTRWRNDAGRNDVYDLQGRKIQDHRPTGIYVTHGKKISSSSSW